MNKTLTTTKQININISLGYSRTSTITTTVAADATTTATTKTTTITNYIKAIKNSYLTVLSPRYFNSSEFKMKKDIFLNDLSLQFLNP